MCDCSLFFVYRRVGSCILNKRRADVCQVEGVEKCRVSLLSFFLVFSLLLHDVVLVAECGQTGARETMQLGMLLTKSLCC
jgi:hypothetical protein